MLQDAPILVVDDDPKIVSLICLYLERDGFKTVSATDGAAALDLIGKQKPCLVVLDLMLPKVSGLEVCRRLRERSDTPVLMLTAKVEEEDKLAGLALGADDYMTKPFSPRELVARAKAILRRTGMLNERRPKLILHGVEVDLDRHRVKVDGQEVYLTAFEFKLLVALMEFPGRVFGREQLLAQVYSYDEMYVVDRTIDVHIGKLRQKVEADPAKPERIITVRGVGYKFREAGSEEWSG
ncbi:MAG TPA: response regulator transcription factor [Symbiobacteriaceae bacterium]|nr:response regulator transcription factor [Symbiobacteriaceae bacterium]